MKKFLTLLAALLIGLLPFGRVLSAGAFIVYDSQIIELEQAEKKLAPVVEWQEIASTA